MRFRVDLKGEVAKRIRDSLERAGWIHSDSGWVDVIVSHEPHPLVPTILVGNDEDVYENVLDVLRGDESPETMKLRVKLYESYLKSGDYEIMLEEEFTRSKRYSIPLSLAVFRLMDTDTDALRCLMKVIREHARKSDKMFRVSDEDVVVVLIGTDIEGAEVFMRRIRRRYSREYLKKSVLKEPDFLWGIATLEDWMISSEDLLASLEFDLLRRNSFLAR